MILSLCQKGLSLSNLVKNRCLQCLVSQRTLHTSYALNMFWQRHPRDGYSKAEEKVKKMTRTEKMRFALQIMKEEVKKWKEEVKERFEMDPILVYRRGEIDIVFDFKSQESLDKWICTSDSDHGQGHSFSTFKTTQQGTGLFSGEVHTELRSDGKVKIAGYCNVRSKRVRKSFQRDSYYVWSPYTHIVFKVRGDGRTYLLNLHCAGSLDVLWNDTFQYMLYTRGGPYWQVTKIPFSKFFFSSKGRIQDLQCAIDLNRVSNVGITVGDNINGPFNLEIDYVGLEYHPDHTEEFAYETYKVGDYIPVD